MMRAARIHGYNAVPVLEDVATPDIGPDDVVVRVEAASLNPLDVKLQKGFMDDFFPLGFPFTMGTDLAGTVAQIGSGVSGWSAGDKIVARLDPTSGGAFAEFAVVPPPPSSRRPPRCRSSRPPIFPLPPAPPGRRCSRWRTPLRSCQSRRPAGHRSARAF